MKIAYLGYDLSAIRTDTFFKSKDIQVSYFLAYPNVEPTFLPYSKTNLLTDNLMISTSEDALTTIQKVYFNKLKKHHELLRRELSYDSVPEAESGVDRNSMANINDMQVIIDIQFESKTKKILIEIEKHGVEEFDFLISEQHGLLSLELEKKNIHLFSKQLKTPAVWTTFNFRIEYADLIEFETKNMSFFIILDSEREAIADNWLHCQLVGQKFLVSSFLPYSQVMNPSYQAFFADRIRHQVNERIHFIQIKKLDAVTLSTVGANYDSHLFTMKSTAGVPNFSFWTRDQIDSYLQKQTLKKIMKTIANSPGNKTEAEL